MAYPVRGSEDPTPEERQARISALARGETLFAVAATFKVSYSAIKQFKKRHLPEIEAEAELLQLGIDNLTSQLWVGDQVALQELRQTLIEDILQRREAPDLPARDVSRYNRDIDQLAFKASELAGLVKQRTQAEVEIQSSIPLGSRLVMTADGQFHEVDVRG